jgi:hypothetical protein
MNSLAFEMNGQPVPVSLEPDGWLVASSAVATSPRELLMKQPLIFSPAKVIPGPLIRAELPVSKRNGDKNYSVLQFALREALSVIEGRQLPPRETPDLKAIAERLKEYLTRSPWEWSQESDGFLLRVEKGIVQKVQIEIKPECVRFASEIGRGHLKPISLNAVCHFVLALNSKLRFARGSLTAEGIELEAVIPAVHLSSLLIEKAVGSVLAGARASKRECALLFNEDFARQYLAFQEEGR